MGAADAQLQAAMAAGNAVNEERFGRVHLVAAAGLSAEDLLAPLEARLGNDAETQSRVVRDELGNINRQRLQRLLAPVVSPVPPVSAGTNLTTHVLDAARGRPAVGVTVRLEDRAGTVLARASPTTMAGSRPRRRAGRSERLPAGV